MEKFKVTAENYNSLPPEIKARVQKIRDEREKKSGIKILTEQEALSNFKFFIIDPSIEGNPIVEESAAKWEAAGLTRGRNGR